VDEQSDLEEHWEDAVEFVEFDHNSEIEPVADR
jgi:hypothetical protein